MSEESKAKSTFEIVCNEKTYVSKKMNPIRRSLIIKKIVGHMNQSSTGDANVGITSMGTLFEKNLPEVMWEFVKDEDKTTIGNYDAFVEDLDDENCLKFLAWTVEKVGEVNDFLGLSKIQEQPPA